MAVPFGNAGILQESHNKFTVTTNIYSLRPKILVILGFKICPKKQVTLPYLESACACKNQLVPNMDNI